MSEYIDRESIRRVLMDVCSDKNCPMFIAATVDQMIDYEPAADVAPVIHSKWEICCDGYYPYCLNCRAEPPGREMTKYCPNCGAKMDGRNET